MPFSDNIAENYNKAYGVIGIVKRNLNLWIKSLFIAQSFIAVSFKVIECNLVSLCTMSD